MILGTCDHAIDNTSFTIMQNFGICMHGKHNGKFILLDSFLTAQLYLGTLTL